MYVDFKQGSWSRIQIPEELEEKVLAYLKEGHEPGELFCEKEFEDLDGSWQVLDTSEYLTPEENQGSATIEIFNNDGESIWSNAINQKDEKEPDTIMVTFHRHYAVPVSMCKERWEDECEPDKEELFWYGI